MPTSIRQRQYEEVKAIAAAEETSHNGFELLLDIYDGVIHSRRRREAIKTMGDLIDVLEERDALAEFNLEPLNKILLLTGNEQLEIALETYYLTPENRQGTYVLENQYRKQRLVEYENDRATNKKLKQSTLQEAMPPLPNSTACACQSNNFPSMDTYTEEKRNAIHKLIAEHIGNYWRKLGRELEIGEGVLDNIEMQHPMGSPFSASERVRRILQIYEEDETHDRKQHLVILCRALDLCKRKDVRRKVEQIILN